MALVVGAALFGGAVVVGGTALVAQAASVPSAPDELAAIGYVNRVRVTWSGSSDDGGSPVTGYRVRNTVNGTVWNVAAGSESTYLTGLPNGAALTLRVAAVNAVGTGPESDPFTVTPHATFTGPVWKPGKDMLSRREHGVSTVLKDGRVLVAGGDLETASGFTPVPAAEIYTPATNTWKAVDPLPSFRSRFSLTTLTNGKVLLAGGFTAAGVPDRRAWLLNPGTGHWTPTGTMHTARAEHSATLLRNGTILAAGGWNTTTPTVTATSETYDPATGTWTTAGSMLHARERQLAVRLPDRAGRVLVAGGNPGGDGLRSSEIYQPATRTWVATGDMVVARIHDDAGLATITLLKDGRVLVAGGYRFGPTDAATGPTRTAEIWTPATGKWALTRNMPFATEAGHTAALLPSGVVVVAGGQDNYGPLAVTQLFNPTTGLWTRGNDLRVQRSYHVAAPLAGGKVLVAGGQRDLPYATLRSSEIYTP
jgi:hypothetical protein